MNMEQTNNNQYVYFDISVNKDLIGRVVFKLYSEKAPKACSNFYELCKRENNGYTNTLIHRIIKNFMIQAGDITYGNLDNINEELLGTGGESIYDDSSFFEDENHTDPEEFKTKREDYKQRHMKLVMANHGEPNTNKSQFFILTADDSSHLVGKHTVFGEVVHGLEVIRLLENVEVSEETGFPKSLCYISESGEYVEGMETPFAKGCNSQISGDIYTEFPCDEFSIGDDDFDHALKVIETIKSSGGALFKQKRYSDATFKYLKSLRYTNEFIPDIDINKDLHVAYKQMKVTLYLNLALCYINSKNYELGLKFCDYILDNGHGLKPETVAKAHYRKSLCLIPKFRYEDALKELKLGLQQVPEDQNISKKILFVEELIEKEKEKQKQKMSKFFE